MKTIDRIKKFRDGPPPGPSIQGYTNIDILVTLWMLLTTVIAVIGLFYPR